MHLWVGKCDVGKILKCEKVRSEIREIERLFKARPSYSASWNVKGEFQTIINCAIQRDPSQPSIKQSVENHKFKETNLAAKTEIMRTS